MLENVQYRTRYLLFLRSHSKFTENANMFPKVFFAKNQYWYKKEEFYADFKFADAVKKMLLKEVMSKTLKK